MRIGEIDVLSVKRRSIDYICIVLSPRYTCALIYVVASFQDEYMVILIVEITAYAYIVNVIAFLNIIFTLLILY